MAPEGGEDIASNLAASESCGFDLRHFDTIAPQRQTIARNDLAVDMLNADTEAFRFDFENAAFTPPEAKTLHLPVTAAGRCLGSCSGFAWKWSRASFSRTILR